MRHIATLSETPSNEQISVVGNPAGEDGKSWGSIYETPTMQVVVLASVAASTFHGYRRNQSVGWAVWWGLMGGLFPIVTPAIAVAQGFGKKA